MAGPWEQYKQTAPESDGPWAKYSAPMVPESPGLLTQFGRGVASLADTVVGDIPGMIVGQVAYPIARAVGQTPEQATRISQNLSQPIANPVGKFFGVVDTPEYQRESSRQLVQSLGRGIERGSAAVAGATGLPEADVQNMAGTLMLTAPQIAKAAAPVVKKGVQKATTAATDAYNAIPAVQERAAAKQAARVQESFERAPQIEAAQEAHRLGYTVDPSRTNPTKANKVQTTIAGQRNLQQKLLEKNEGITEARMREDLGLPENADLRQPKVWDDALNQERITQPYEQIRTLGTVADDGSILSSLNKLREKFTWDQKNAGPMMAAIDNAVNRVESGLTGAEVLDGIRQLRKESNDIYNAQRKGNIVDPDKIALAETKIEIANTLEQLLENNIADPKFREAFKNARTEAAKIYDAKNATNPLTGKVDPFYYVKKAENGQAVTGFGGSLARIAGNYPELFKEAGSLKLDLPELRRSSPSGVAGAGLAAALAGVSGAGLGTAALAGAGVGVLGQRLMRNRLLSPEFQARNAVPMDYRPVNQLIPERPPISNAPVPYNYAQAVNEGQPSYQPNFEMRGGPRGADRMVWDAVSKTYRAEFGPGFTVRPETPQAPNNLLGYSPELKGDPQINALRMEDQRLYGAAAAADAQAAAQAEAAAQASRRPATGEVLLDFDPITGRLRPSSRGLPGATLDVIESTGKSLESASQKIAAGKNFDLTAAEKVAWDKTRSSLSTVSPEFRNLTDKQILDRMMDRQWIADTVKKSKDKAEAFSQIAARSEKADQIRAALKAREEMMDLAESLDLMMQQGRPVPKSGQGPKTREAIRNMLLGQ